jgi:hypothetical protein
VIPPPGATVFERMHALRGDDFFTATAAMLTPNDAIPKWRLTGPYGAPSPSISSKRVTEYAATATMRGRWWTPRGVEGASRR